MSMSVPIAQFSALAQRLIRLPSSLAGVTLSTIVETGRCPPGQAVRLQRELDAIEQHFRITRNRPDDYAPRLAEAYDELGLHFLSQWEEAELEVHEKLSNGGYESCDGLGDYNLANQLWYLGMFGGDLGWSKLVPLLDQYIRDATANQRPCFHEAWLRDGSFPEPEVEPLVARFVAKPKRAKKLVLDRPVKTAEGLNAQIHAFITGAVDADVLRKSFHAWFGYCYHHESPSNLADKKTHAMLYSRLLEPGAPRNTLDVMRSSLAMFKPARVATRMIFIADVPPIMSLIEGLRELARAGGGVRVVRGETSVELTGY